MTLFSNWGQFSLSHRCDTIVIINRQYLYYGLHAAVSHALLHISLIVCFNQPTFTFSLTGSTFIM